MLLVDIEGFYDADERRRASVEVELGTEWRDRDRVRYELSWIADTGELYVMREQPPIDWADPFGGIHVRHGSHGQDDEAEVAGMTVFVVAQIPTREQLNEVLDGWEAAMAGADGIAWLIARLRQHGVAVFADPESSPAS